MNETKNTVSIHINEAQAVAIMALLGGHVSGQILEDLGLNKLYGELENELGEHYTTGASGIITRQGSDTVTVRDYRSPRHTIIDLLDS